MKKYGSVCSLLIRSVFYPLLLILVLSAALQTGLFYVMLRQGPQNDVFHLEMVLQRSGLQWVFGAAMTAATVFLCRTGCTGSSHPGYAIRRLQISEDAVFWLQALCNFLFYLLFWAAELLLVLGLGHLFTVLANSAYVTSQTVFLSLYRSPFLHTLLPMEDIYLWFADALLLVTLSICAARYPLAQRRGKKFGEIFLVLLVLLTTLSHKLQDFTKCTFTVIACGALLLFSLAMVLSRKEYDDEEA